MRFKLSTIALLATLLTGGSVAAQTPSPTPKIEDVVSTVGKEFKSVEGGFTVLFPGTPKLEEATANTGIGPIKTHLAILEKGSEVYYVSYVDLPAGLETPEEIKQGLDSSRDQAIAGGHRLISESNVTISGVDGRELLMEKNGLVIRGRFFYLKQRLYQLIFGTPATLAFRNGKSSANPADRTDAFETTSTRFFESFKLAK
jgi:hypothetical protein